jgi:hypothetical protein
MPIAPDVAEKLKELVWQHYHATWATEEAAGGKLTSAQRLERIKANFEKRHRVRRKPRTA